jgi:hypothetical protein
MDVAELKSDTMLGRPVSRAQTNKSVPPATHYLTISCCSHLEHTASVKCFVSLQFLNLYTDSRTPGMGDQPDGRLLPTQANTNAE